MSKRQHSETRDDVVSSTGASSGRRPIGLRVPSASSLLGVPLFYKILVANAAIFLVGAAATAVLATGVTSATEPAEVVLLLGLLVVGLLVAGMVLNALLIRAALLPLEALERTARLVDGGDLDARVPPSPLADRSTVKLARLFNRMLDGQAAIRDRNRDQAAKVLEAEEMERNRSSRELHDELAQTLAGVLVRLRVATLNPEIEHAPSVEAYLDEIRAEVREALEHVREVARRLHPPELEELGLLPALEAYARSVTEVSGVRVELHGEGINEGLSPESRLATFRIIQESLITAIRHSHADRIRVGLRRTNGLLSGEVVDDGDGFDPVADLEGTPVGQSLARILERAAIVGGEVTVESAVGRGTRMEIQIPVQTTVVQGAPNDPLAGVRKRGRVGKVRP